ncbi:hypothetical protein PV05_00129 [Exophiala xenobiotica]|uniref:Condensation domain-containing protein n=1 Tax=Exophiala xenobiotica TaxID=348802 RepID=A0A0D2EVV4_9EURO|nr:uncharacterized protein PV05_00129 [Exophiala xenobiotica]KIW59863.1 hypothetical protein PV05_00129 [Exophiala xenobiotica]
MSYIETSTGLYRRPLSLSEKGMVAAVGAFRPSPRELIKIYAFADFTVTQSAQTVEKVVSAFASAWKALRLLRSPDIATSFEDGFKLYHVPSPEAFEAWLSRTFIVSEAGTSVQSAVRAMQQRIELLPAIQLIPHATEDGTFQGTLILSISHWRTEASGAFKTLNQLFDYAADLLSGTATTEALSRHHLGDEACLLTPATEDILMPDRQSTPEAKTRVEKRFDNYYSKLPCIDFPMQGSPSDPFSTAKEIRHTYNPSTTGNLRAACKAHGITITSAVHSAYLGAVWTFAPSEHANRNYASLMPAQVRTRLPPSSPYRDQGCWSAAQMLMLTLPPNQNFLARARDLRSQYKLADQESWWYEDALETSEQVSQLAVKTPAGQPVSFPWFTGLGLLDGETIVPEHGDIKVDDVDFFADPLSPGIVLRVWTFKERLNIHVVWNAAYHTDEQLRRLMDAIHKSLAADLGVKVEVEMTEDKEY